jgi:hydrogenase maturation factor
MMGQKEVRNWKQPMIRSIQKTWKISNDELCSIVLNGKQLPANCEKIKDCTYNTTIGMMNV